MKTFFITLFLLIFLTVAGIGGYAYLQYEDYLKSTVKLSDDSQNFVIKRGSSINTVAKALAEKGILAPDYNFIALARLTKRASKIKAGEYQLDKGMTPEDVLSVFVRGKSIEYQLSIIDGKTFKILSGKVQAHPQLKQTLTTDDYGHLMEKVGEAKITKPEGMFFPDTYNFPKNTTDLQFYKRSYESMQKHLMREWENREPNPHIKTPYEALILASIVEKETGVASERPLIARVFLNRLERGMMLQTDPTVIYGMGVPYEGSNIRRSDLRRDTPYNTYTRFGLPPTPIATPSLAAIKAVMHPEDSDFLYFVAKGDGSSYFSKTLREHENAVNKYQR